MSMFFVLIPLTTICVALVGFYVWHRQLIRKRHFEVAEAALSAFCRAEAALAYARAPTRHDGEGSSRKREPGELPPHSRLLDRLYVPVERLKQHNEAFGELERAAFNVEVHFGDEVAHPVREPLRAYNQVAAATACRMKHVGISIPESLHLARKLEAIVYSSGGQSDTVDADQVSIDLDKAKSTIETNFGPYLAAPTFGEFLLPPALCRLIKCGLAVGSVMRNR